MSCFTFYIFNRQGVCQYYHEWSRPKPVQQGAGSIQEDFKLMFGLCWSMKAFTAALHPKVTNKQQMGAPTRIGDGTTFHSFKTDTYRLHFFETLSGLKFVLITAPGLGSMVDHLQYIYKNLYVELVVKNPFYTPGEAFLFETFTISLNKYMLALGLLS